MLQSMRAIADDLDLSPPRPPGRAPAWALALLAHAALLAALAWGVSWRHQTSTEAVQAELWAAVPQPAAPRPAPPQQPPQVQPPQVQPARPAAPPTRDADIALQREREQQALARQREAEAARQRQAREQADRERQARAEAERQRQQQAQQRAREQEQARAADAARREAEQREKDRQAAIAKALAAAAGAGSGDAPGSASRSAGPSDSYAGRVRARVRPNIVFTEDPPGNPQVEVEVRVGPGGLILSQRILKSSGLRSWDEAVLRALDRTERLPADVDGRHPSPLLLVFRPRD